MRVGEMSPIPIVKHGAFSKSVMHAGYITRPIFSYC